MSRIIFSCVVGVCLSLCGLADAWAIRTEVLTIKPLEIDVFTNPDKIVHLHFPMNVELLSAGNFTGIKNPEKHIITIKPEEWAGTNILIGGNQYRVVINAIPRSAHEVETLIDFIEPEVFAKSRPNTHEERERSHWYTLLHKLSEEDLSNSQQIPWDSGQHHIDSTIGNVTSGERYLSFVATLHNTGEFDYPLSGVQLREAGRDADHLVLAVPDTIDLRLPKVLKRGETLRIAVMAKNSALLGDDWSLALMPTIGLPAALFRWGDWSYTVPISRGRVAIGVEATGGVARYEHGSDNQFGLSRGVRVRARYGVSQLFAVEGLLGLIDTTEVAFQDGSAAQMTGGQAMVSGVLTLGDLTAPFIRAGAGVVPAMIRDADDSRFDLFPAFSLGIGVDMWLKQKLLVGIAVDGTGSTNENMPFTLAASVHVSYAWLPRRR